MTYAIIKVGGKQYRVREGERLLVDRLAEDEGATITPAVLLVGGDDREAVLHQATSRSRPGSSAPSRARRSASASTRSARATAVTRASAPRSRRSRSSRSEARKRRAAKKTEARRRRRRQTPAETPEAEERVKGMPAGYEQLTVAAIKEASTHWNRPMLEAALEYEQAHANRKGAIAAIESALADKEEGS